MKFCKRLLGVKANCNNAMVYIELGCLPLRCVRIIRMIKYWFKLLGTTNCILKFCYVNLTIDCKAKRSCSNWAAFIRSELYSIGLGELLEHQEYLVFQKHFPIIKKRIIDVHCQELYAVINNSPKCYIFSHLIDNFCMQSYLLKPIPKKFKRCITKYRLESHSLAVESGRYKNIARNERKCIFCNHNDIEDVFHFVLKCPLYNSLRSRYIKNYYVKKPSVFKLVQLLSSNNTKELCNLGKYLHYATMFRNSLL